MSAELLGVDHLGPVPAGLRECPITQAGGQGCLSYCQCIPEAGDFLVAEEWSPPDRPAPRPAQLALLPKADACGTGLLT